ncbi:MAG: hypothetical protein ACI9HK_002528 [Pirellulaceae bacterium]|jgi:hypothetical protein
MKRTVPKEAKTESSGKLPLLLPTVTAAVLVANRPVVDLADLCTNAGTSAEVAASPLVGTLRPSANGRLLFLFRVAVV